MSPDISKTRSRKSKQRDKQDRKKKPFRMFPITQILLGLLLWLTVLALIYGGGDLQTSLLAEGQQAPDTVISSIDFECEDLARMELSARQVADRVPPVFTASPEAYKRTTRNIGKLLDRLEAIRATEPALSPEEQQHELALVIDLLGLTAQPDELLNEIEPGQEEQTRKNIDTVLRKTANDGIVSSRDRDTSFGGLAQNEEIVVESTEGIVSSPRPIENLPEPDQARKQVLEALGELLPGPPRKTAQWLEPLLKPGLVPNLIYNRDQTETARLNAKGNLPVILKSVRAGTTILERGEPITANKLSMVRAYERRLKELQTPLDRLLNIIGDSSLLFISLIVCVGLFQMQRPDILQSKSKTLLTILLSLAALVPARGLLSLSDLGWIDPSLIKFLIPLALPPLLGAILLDGFTAVIIGFWTSFAAAILFGHSFSILINGMLVSIVAAQCAQEVHRRSRMFRAGLWVGLAGILFVVTAALIDQQAWPVAVIQGITILLNGLFCAFIALLLIPLFELLFGITTDITLLELSDMGNPLLQRLAMEAPGTYHHSIMVANLGAAAAREIGANELLVRVCAYFHDIGKLTKPEFFIENAQYRHNPHDDLAPSMSTLVITSHVKEGLTLAMRHKLPRVVLDGIREHHGTGLVSYFYHRARQQKEAEQSAGSTRNGDVQEQDFRYPGPRPTTPEMAILSLADSLEAASRSMEKPTASRIENLVSEIIRSKLDDGQLNETRLTLAQLSAIRRSFVFTLTNMLHGRVAYPQDENRNKQSTAKSPASDEGTPGPADVPDDAGSTGKS